MREGRPTAAVKFILPLNFKLSSILQRNIASNGMSVDWYDQGNATNPGHSGVELSIPEYSDVGYDAIATSEHNFSSQSVKF